ncbi:L-2,4-diaminobutyric acid acetyltransferase [Stieleria varia]|uniref:L-2,4-diaminobutyric acid acetyltransferase n=1 Tax=Stieleria varia TaxID=2528005 RepID=A0A5C6A5T2_9BACT|nr:L-2,4-diaminobutyric acid acetyltransferase [Stieleria varia]
MQNSGVLDTNSAYLYLLLCRDFRDTCLVACQNEAVVGFVSGYRMPRDPSVLFVWQIGVAGEVKRRGVASALLRELVSRCGQGELTAIEATIASTNTASRLLFESLARSLDLPITDHPHDGFSVADFPCSEHESSEHEAEPRIRIGPFVRCSPGE